MWSSILKLITGQRGVIPLVVMAALLLASAGWIYTQGSHDVGSLSPVSDGPVDSSGIWSGSSGS